MKRFRSALARRIEPRLWDTMLSLTSAPFRRPKSGRIAVRIITTTGDEMLAVRDVPERRTRRFSRQAPGTRGAPASSLARGPPPGDWRWPGESLQRMAIMTTMREIAAREAKNRFGQLLEASQRAPVTLTRHGRAVSVVMSVEQYDRLRGAAWDRLMRTMDEIGEKAAAAGMTEEILNELLADES